MSRANRPPTPGSSAIGSAQRARNSASVPSRPGVVQSRIDHSSTRSFSTGVPVSATRAADGMRRSAAAVPDAGFFTCCASSATTRPHRCAASASTSSRIVAYVVRTNPSCSGNSRPLPW
jgi:hypothetical protein